MTEKAFYAPGSDGLLQPLSPWLNDLSVSEILINRPQEVFVERQGQMVAHAVPALDSLHLKRLFGLIANENRQLLNEANPLLSGNLMDGSRVQLVIPPAAKHYTLSIRRQTVANRSLTDYERDFYREAKPFLIHDKEALFSDADKQLLAVYRKQLWPDFIDMAVLAKKNIVISGGTSSGKTTFLNACCQRIPQGERIITLEDTYEVRLPHKNQVNLLAPKTKDENALTMQDLVQCSLRLRPDRLMMGEIRGREVLDFIAACSTGHDGSMTSIHANNPQIALMRMVQLYKLNNVPSMRDEDILREINQVVDIIIQLQKTPNGRGISWIYFKGATSEPLVR
ncbi:P-type DNA transfer ATPase VirB11 [Legionella sp. 16cNR16C]|uniref:P-type DNA transfer ATPase VirB11 n=1 Tax=Legionella sp. 16cNR16C TaxID=2905656 RepID=UPI001E610922|nr:P-type DNA transfer ATPase VirB11 [Legionella sp. 16cNR16C]MCE3043970.1 P-type DNA transfer ATPase VirB11 [Legionella sp. 16cNR16C]